MLNPVQGDGRYADSLPFFGGLSIWKANPLIVDKLREVGALFHSEKLTHSYMHCWRHKTPIIYRATTQWFVGMDDVPGYHGHRPAGVAARDRVARHRSDHVLSGMGQGALAWNDRAPAGLDAVAATVLGRAAAVLCRPRNGHAAPGHDGAARARRIEGRARRHRVVVRCDLRGLRRRSREVSQAHRHARRVVRFRRDVRDGAGRAGRPQDAHGLAFAANGLSGRSLSRRLGPASRLVPFVAARIVHGQRRAAVQGAADARLCRRRRRQEDVEVEGQRRRAAEGVRHARRGNPAPVGRRHRLFGRIVDFRRDPEARGGKLPPHPQHAALPAREHRRFRSGARRRADRRAVRDGPLRACAGANDGHGRRARISTATSSIWSCNGCRRTARNSSAGSTSTC